ncbi:putative N-acetyl-LL-diaminopimelate aminotransferase PatA [Gottschalkia purinilytica]|uniref:Aminotransferase n=2 Tax=Gottschalkia purinilytica TaxID=1503 RepID=A0A0L0WDL8_GOTPU|nr:putative N-acetyl-LL-diaminopimelate aminotransferase PatA [Gottschalkia purinilytica]
MIPSMTIGITDKLEELKRNGIDIIKFNIGEPDFNTPENISNAAKKALDEGFTRYTVVSGILELREAIVKKLKEDNNLDYEVNNIVVSSGAKQALMNTILAICEEDDEVIIPTPCWVSYIEMIKLSGSKPVLVSVDEKNGFKLNIDKIREAITDKTKAILINTPNNPTGAVYSKEDLRELGKLAVENDFYIISDEIYEKLVYDGERHVSIASLSSEIKEKTITINGFSKAYAMTGWRLGYAVGPKDIIKGMNDIQGHMTSGPNSIAQKAGVEALTGPQESISIMIEEYGKRRKYLIEKLQGINGITCPDVKGAFYVMPDVSSFYGKEYDGKVIKDSIDLSEFLLEKAHIAVVPGIAFEAPNSIRISYSNSLENIKEGIGRMEKALELLR